MRVFHFFFQGLQGIGLWYVPLIQLLHLHWKYEYNICGKKASDLQVWIVEAKHLSVDEEQSVVADEETADPQNELSFKEKAGVVSELLWKTNSI